jgi:phosphocarrier protein HPr
MYREVEIVNEMGLHARPAAEFVRCVQRFQSAITIQKDEEQFNAGSILEVLSACLDCGTRITIEAVGPDAEEALERLAELLVKFKEEDQSENH